MVPPGNQTWSRVEEIRSKAEGMEPEELAQYLSELAGHGESVTLLSWVSDLLSLPPLAPPLSVGDVLEHKYTLVEKLGEGGMGSVWRAREKIIGHDVAIKVIHPALVSPATQGRFHDEMVTLGKLEHPSIVKILTSGQHQHVSGTIGFFVMQLVEGTSLANWAAAHREDRAALLRMMSEICRAIQHAHDKGIVHRDLKPSNIMVSNDGHPVVLDFGIARLAREVVEEETEGFSGSLDYAAPEQHRRDPIFDKRECVDIYAAGVILFELLSGRRLYVFPPETSLIERTRTISEGRAPRLSHVLCDCPPDIDALVAQAVELDPNARYTSIGGFGRAVKRVARSLYGPPKPAPPLWTPAAGLVVPGTCWKLAALLGQGSTGQVWRATHETLSESRVFKFCDSEEKTRSLKRELTLFNLLKDRVGQNPHFISLHQVSLNEAPWYLLMDYVDAQDLETWCAAQPGGLAALPHDTSVEIVAQVAEALQEAHTAGVLHRDLKPSNILIRALEPLHVFVSDFGIGYIVGAGVQGGGATPGDTSAASDLRLTGPIVGSMPYLAPEAAREMPTEPQADIYSLGVVFLQLLAGDFQLVADANWRINVDDPLLREDLDRCLAGKPSQRWASAGAFAASLRALPQRRAAEKQRQDETTRRERAAYLRGVWRTASIAALMILGIGALAWYAWTQSFEAKKQTIETKRQRNVAVAGQAQAALAEFKGLLILKPLDCKQRLFQDMPKLEISDPVLQQDFRTTIATMLSQLVFEPIEPSSLQLQGTDSIGERGERAILADAAKGGAAVLDLGTADLLRFALPKVPPGMQHLRVSARGLFAGGVGADGALHLWKDLDGPEPVMSRVIAGPVHAGGFAISPTTLSKSLSHAVAIPRADGAIDVLLEGNHSSDPVRLIRPASENEDVFPVSAPATMLAFCSNPEGVLAAAGQESNLLFFWALRDSNDGKLDGEFAGCLWHPDTIRCLKWSPVDRKIATGADDGFLRIWQYARTDSVPRDEPMGKSDFGEPICDVAWTIDGELIAVLLQSGRIRLLNVRTPEAPLSNQLDAPGAQHIAFLGFDKLVAWGDGETRMWGQRDAYFQQKVIATHETFVSYHHGGGLTAWAGNSISFLAPGSLAWTGGFKVGASSPAGWLGDSLIHRRNQQWYSADSERMQNPACLRIAPGKLLKISLAVVSPMGRHAVYWDGLRLELHHSRDPSGGDSNGKLLQLKNSPDLLTVSDAAPLVAWREQDEVKIHHFGTGTSFTHRVPGVLSLSFPPQPGLLACRTERGVVFVSTDGARAEFCPLPAPAAGSTPMAFSPDGHWLAVCGHGQDVILGAMPPAAASGMPDWISLNTIFTSPIVLRRPAPKRIVSLAWDPNGTRLACGTADGFVQTWNVSLLRRTLRLWRLDWSDAAIPSAAESFIPIKLN